MAGSNTSGTDPGRDAAGHESGRDSPLDAPSTNGDTGRESFDPRQLDLGDDDDAGLPWLDADDDDNAYESPDGLRILAFVLAGLVVVSAIIGGIWWATHRDPAPEPVADGSTIAAPAVPFKEAPGNPGGKKFDGTGDSSFAMSEGESRPARLGEAESPPSRPDTDPSSKAPAPAVGVGVQVGAYSTREKAEAGWSQLASSPALEGVRHRVVEGQADIGTVYRLQAVAADAAGAQALCARLKAAGISCQVKN